MPAQMFITHKQLETMSELGEDVVVLEGPGSAEAQALECWVMDQESLNSKTNRSVIVDQEGDILGDHRIEED